MHHWLIFDEEDITVWCTHSFICFEDKSSLSLPVFLVEIHSDLCDWCDGCFCILNQQDLKIFMQSFGCEFFTSLFIIEIYYSLLSNKLYSTKKTFLNGTSTCQFCLWVSTKNFFTSLSPPSSLNDNVCSEKLEYEIQWWGNEEKYERKKSILASVLKIATF
jgi:hypothetical protein